MVIKITQCYETSLGIIIVFDTPPTFIPYVGIRIENEEREIWEVKSISFNQKQKQSEITNSQENFLENSSRSYQVISMAENIPKKNMSICEYFKKTHWKIIE